ncbi:MAG: helix-turn-helix transcriptional regulator, partial [Rhodospirillales bacterium]|nr:helix-turn-helix transcriptional regulator [Rhodospirillales bacterium]
RPRAMSSNVDLPHGAGGRATLTLLPLGMATDWTLPRPPAILAVQHGPPAGARVPPDQLAALFGLTRAEAELAIDLLAGLAPAQIAARRSRSIHTIRTHLARLMAKTQTRGQGELVRLLASIPAPTETEGGSR